MVSAKDPCDQWQDQWQQEPAPEKTEPSQKVQNETDSDSLDAHAAFFHGAVGDHAEAGAEEPEAAESPESNRQPREFGLRVADSVHVKFIIIIRLALCIT